MMKHEDTMTTIKEHLAAIQRGRDSVEGNVQELRAEAAQLRKRKVEALEHIMQLRSGAVSRDDFIAILCRAVDNAGARFEHSLLMQLTSNPYYKAPNAANLINAAVADLAPLASRLLSPIPQVDITSDAVCFYFGDLVKAGLKRVSKKLPWRHDETSSVKDAGDAIELITKEVAEIDAMLADISEVAGFAGIEL